MVLLALWSSTALADGGAYDQLSNIWHLSLGSAQSTAQATVSNTAGWGCKSPAYCNNWQWSAQASTRPPNAHRTQAYYDLSYKSYNPPGYVPTPRTAIRAVLHIECDSGYHWYTPSHICVVGAPPPPPPPPPPPEEYFLVLTKSTSVKDADSGKPCPCHGDPVNPSTGGEYQAIVDLPASGPLQTLAFNRYYNSLDTSSRDLGPAWRHSYSRSVATDATITQYGGGSLYYSSLYSTAASACSSGWSELKLLAGQPDTTASYSNGACEVSSGSRVVMSLKTYSISTLPATSNAVNVIRDDGRILHFTRNGSTFVPEQGIVERMSLSGSDYRLVDADDNVELYDSSGRLKSVTDRVGNTQVLGYTSNRLSSVTDSFGRSLSLYYDGAGRLQSIIGPDNLTRGYGYDSGGRLASMQHPDGKHRQYLYTDNDWPNGLTRIVDENDADYAIFDYDYQGRVVSERLAGDANVSSLTYNADGTTTATDALGAARDFGYEQIGGHMRIAAITGAPCIGCGYDKGTTRDNNGYVASRTDYRDHVTTYTHDARGLESSRIEAYGTAQARRISTEWSSTYRLPTRIAGPRLRTTLSYDGDGSDCGGAAGALCSRRVQETTDLDGSQGFSATLVGTPRVWSYTYNSAGQVLMADGPRSDVSDITTYSYYTSTAVDGSYRIGDLSSVTNALGHTTQITQYDAMGRPKRIVDPNGLVTLLDYNLRGQLLSQDIGGLVTGYTYYDTGLLKKITLPSGDFLRYTYDDAHRLTHIHDSLGSRIRYTLDARGNRTAEEVFDPSNTLRRTQTRVYDSLSRLHEIHGANGQQTTLDYDANGNNTAETVAGSNAVTTRAYDALNRLFAITDAMSGVTQYSYDAQDRLTSVTDPRGLVTSYTRTGFGEVTQLQSPDTGTTAATFNASGGLATRTDAKGQLATYSHDALNRLTQIDYAGGPTIVYGYDQGPYGKGRLTGLSDVSGSSSWTYDVYGRITARSQTVSGVTQTTQYSYDSVGRLETQTLPSGKVLGYSWSGNRLSGVTLDGNPLASGLAWEPFGPASGWSFANGEAVSRTFDLSGRMSGHSLGTIAYDTADRITGLTHGGLSQLGGSKTYGYDDLDRLTGYQGAGYTIGYDYDATGNRTLQSGTGGSVTSTIDSGSNKLLDLTSSGGTQSFSYDANGSITADGLHAYGYDQTGRLAGVDSGSWAYGYNALGQRVVKSGGGGNTLFVYDEAGHLLGEYDGATGAAIQETVWLGDTPLAVLKGSSSYYVHADHLNTPRQIDDQNGDPVWLWDTITFGGSTPDQDPLNTGTPFVYNLRHPGQYFDAESGLFQNWRRDYNPNLGRYIESDPIGLRGGINTYAYGFSSPLSMIDPEGTETRPALGWGVAFPPPGVTNGTAWDLNAPLLPQIPLQVTLCLISPALCAAAVMNEQQNVDEAQCPVVSPDEISGKTPEEIDRIAKEKRLVPKGPDPMNGKGAYVDPITGKQRVLIHPSGQPFPHAHVNNPSGDRLGPDGTVVAPESPEAHLPIEYP